MSEFEALSRRLAKASADLKAAMYYIEAAAREEEKIDVGDIVRLSEKAANKLENVAVLVYDKKLLWERSGDLFRKAGNLGMASRAYHTANELQPGDQRLIEKLVEVETINQLEYKLSNSQKPFDTHLLRARKALEYGLDNKDELVEKAILELQTFLNSEVKDLDALFELGGLLKETGDVRGAIECYERVLEVDPENQRAVRFLVYAYSEMGREEDASIMQEKESHELDGFHPRVSNPDVWQAWAFADRGDFESAALHMEKALTHMPGDMVNWEELEYYYIATGQRKKAEKCRDKIRSLRNMLS